MEAQKILLEKLANIRAEEKDLKYKLEFLSGWKEMDYAKSDSELEAEISYLMELIIDRRSDFNKREENLIIAIEVLDNCTNNNLDQSTQTK